ncbi:MAG: aminotransferase class I/II-fold pyridoxal phosphate-dependent enzyme [Kiritimatiellae bacterium]|nr:aminotransferase class I/II-fold pyridoxal phosphate-dependent enzyme [Kiritimatiellia bacterium]
MSNTNKKIFLSPPFVGAAERAAVRGAFDSGYVAPCGPQVDEFERRLAKLAGRKYAVAVSSGTAAIDLLMAELGVDETWTVVAPTLTFIATVGPAFHRGAKLVFVDSDATGNIDISLLEEALESLRVKLGSSRVGATLNDSKSTLKDSKILVIGVDLYGNCCNYGAIAKLCRKFGVVFVTDAAEAVGATRDGRPAGSAGLAGVYSFNGNKIVTTSGGGAIVTDDRGLAERARKRAQQSREKCVWYEHREVGYNYRLSNILAAIGLAQLGRLPTILKKRSANYDWYARNFKGDLLSPTPGANHWLTVAILSSRRERDKLLRRFEAAGIEARPVWKPLHLQPVFAKCRVFGGEVAEALFERGVCLPSGTGLKSCDFDRIARCL